MVIRHACVRMSVRTYVRIYVYRITLKPIQIVWKFNFFEFYLRFAVLGQKLKIWHYYDHKEYGMYVSMYISMYVHRIIFKPI